MQSGVRCAARRAFSQASTSKVTLDAVRSVESAGEVESASTEEERVFYRIAHAAAFGKSALRDNSPVSTRYKSEKWKYAKTRGESRFDVRIDADKVRGKKLPSRLTGTREYATQAATRLIDEGEEIDDDPVVLPRSFGELKPGCLVETRLQVSPLTLQAVLTPEPDNRNGHSTLGIVYERPLSAPPLSRVIEKDGNIVDVRDTNIAFVLPDAVSPDLASACANEDSGREAKHQVVQQLRALVLRIDKAIKGLVSAGASDLYDRLVTRRDAPTSITSAAALSMLKDKHDKFDLMAMHLLMADDYFHFLVDPASHRTTARFDVRDPAELRVLEQVRAWVRDDAPQIKAFATKAASGLRWSRQRPPLPVLDSLGAIAKHDVPPELKWNKDDMMILTFFRKSLERQRVIQPHPYVVIAPTILKAVEGELGAQLTSQAPSLEDGRDRTMAFLGEVGAVAPWEDWPVHELEHVFAEWHAQDQRIISARPLQVKDELDSVRRDFLKLPVYTIDDLGASELDDGISIERGPESSWVHVHVADPTTLIRPGDQLAQLVRNRTQTEYLPEKTFAMIPDALIEKYQLSLGSADGQQRVMTFSIRLDDHGNVLESTVSAGVVGNVKRLTYDAVDSILGHVPPPPRQILRIGQVGEESGKGTARTIDDVANDAQARADLTKLYDLAKALLKKRVDTTALAWQFPTGSISVTPKLDHHFVTSDTPSLYRTSPVLTFGLPRLDVELASPTPPAQVLVSEFMIAANRAAARFSAERGVPIAFRTQDGPICEPEALERVMQMRDPSNGHADAFEVLRNDINFSPGRVQLKPGSHWPMGIHDEYGYTRVTSPLRRYSDLFGHWQLKAALLPSSLSPSPMRRSKFPFTAEETALEMKELESATVRRGKIDKASQDFWRTYFLSRKWRALTDPSSMSTSAANEHDDLELARHLFDSLTAVALRPTSFSILEGYWQQAVWLKEFGVRAQLRFPDESDAIAKGEEVRVKVDQILLSGRSRIIVSKKK